MKPSDNRLLNDPMASIEKPLRRATIDIYRFVGRALKRLSVLVATRLELAAQRRSLQSLDDNMLKDVGLSRCDVEREIRFGGYGGTMADDPHRPLSHELYFHAREARGKAVSDALGWVFANASRRAWRRDGDRHSR